MLKGKVHKYGSDVNTDEIIPARYLYLSEPDELAEHCMEVIVATTNFGCGSSREHAPIAIKASGISCVIGKSFARIFFRNSINIGLPLLESEEAVDGIENGDVVEVDLSSGTITNTNSGKTYTAKPYPGFMGELIAAGGLIEYTKKEVEKLRRS